VPVGSSGPEPPRPSRRDVAVAGHTGDGRTARAGLTSEDGAVRATALGALERLDELGDDVLTRALTDTSARVRRRAAELAARHPRVDLLTALHDGDETVVEMAAWAIGERPSVGDDALERLVELATGADAALVREAAVAALGALGDERGLPAILRATSDKPAVRRRAVLALAPFDGPDVDRAVERALTDRDWQVRQAAEDLRRAAR
jgi:HEAT repeat protein